MASIAMASIAMAYVVMAYIVLAYVVMASILMANVVMAYLVMASIVMAYIVMTYVVLAYVVMVYISMAFVVIGLCSYDHCDWRLHMLRLVAASACHTHAYAHAYTHLHTHVYRHVYTHVYTHAFGSPSGVSVWCLPEAGAWIYFQLFFIFQNFGARRRRTPRGRPSRRVASEKSWQGAFRCLQIDIGPSASAVGMLRDKKKHARPSSSELMTC